MQPDKITEINHNNNKKTTKTPEKEKRSINLHRIY